MIGTLFSEGLPTSVLLVTCWLPNIGVMWVLIVF